MRAALRPGLWAVLALAAAASHLQAQGLEVAAQAQLALVAPQHADADTTRNTWLASARLGLAQQDALANGWQRRLSATAVLRARSGHCPTTVCPSTPDDDYPNADAALQASWWHYARGRFTLGRGPSLLAEQADRSSPFGNATIGADRCASQLAATCQRYHPFSLAYEAPTFGQWTPAAQLAFGDGKPRLTLQSALQLGAGHAWVSATGDNEGHWQLPLGLSLPVGRWRLLASHTTGHTPDGPGRHSLLGLTTPAWGGELRAQWSRQHLPAQTARPAVDATKLAVGVHHPVSLHWTTYLDLAGVNHDDGRRWRGGEAGLRWTW
ncbi:MAG: hypothetical protein CFE45_01610 [Burkholderiales bacterium PBB5]|nr:MAG: hypothetical protein CFE45_01610 [Burkholderiales bacterium PBB5]